MIFEGCEIRENMVEDVGDMLGGYRDSNIFVVKLELKKIGIKWGKYVLRVRVNFENKGGCVICCMNF